MNTFIYNNGNNKEMYPLKFNLPVVIKIPLVTNDRYDTQAISDVQNELAYERMSEGHVEIIIRNFIPGGGSAENLHKLRVLVMY